MRWECRYSSCEMLYLEVRSREVYSYLHHSPEQGDSWSFDDVLAGEHDAEVRHFYGEAAVEQLKAAVRLRTVRR
jgi:hypothetical protein